MWYFSWDNTYIQCGVPAPTYFSGGGSQYPYCYANGQADFYGRDDTPGPIGGPGTCDTALKYLNQIYYCQ
jgi:hypothetical protein